MVNTKELLVNLKSSNQDFEWYPTTTEIIEAVVADVEEIPTRDPLTVLDCGAGDGRVLMAFDIKGRYAIEKSQVHINNLDPSIKISGTDFWQQTLIDKRTTVVFSNPPYSEYKAWSTKVIKEANCGYIYLVIPQRWKDDQEILEAIELREGKAKVLGSYDFLSADRQARAKVDLIKITLAGFNRGYGYTSPKVDPFTLWFNSNFEINTKKEVNSFCTKEAIKQELVHGGDLVATLVSLYQQELEKLISNYKSITTLDPTLLKELGVDLSTLLESFKEKITNLKTLYWTELFNNLSKITTKLTLKSRTTMLENLKGQTNIDFTASNVHSVLIWVIKNANQYFDSQLVDTYSNFITKANVSFYKSNQKVLSEDNWRYYYSSESITHLYLENRLVLNRVGGIYVGGWKHERDRYNGLSERAFNFISDLIVIASNLNYEETSSIQDLGAWDSGKTKVVTAKSKGKEIKLFEVKAFKNGNLHIKLNQEFACKLNVEFGRLKGWLKSAKEAQEELNIPEEQATKHFKSNLALTNSSILSLTQIT